MKLTPKETKKALKESERIREEYRKEYDKFMVQYKKDHEVCPKCGDKNHSSTLAGYVMCSDRREEFKDLNDCVCSKCGDKHTCHERIGAKEFYQKSQK